MSMLKWHRPSDITFETGLDRGVLYPEDGAAVAWNGLISVENAGEAETKELYLDGQKYLTLVSAKDWRGVLEAYTFPDAFSALVGLEEAGDGLYIDSQMPARFHMSYRTMINSPDSDGDKQYYKIHLIYMATAMLGSHQHETLSGDAMSPTAFNFELSAIPQKIPGFRPTAHVVLDTRKIDPITLGTLEGMLYGNGYREPEFPSITELLDMLTFSDTVTIDYNGDGTWTATGSNRNIIVDDRGFFLIHNVEVEYINPSTYVFLEAGGAPNNGGSSIILDTDGVATYGFAPGNSGLGIDVDSVPFVDMEENDALIYPDEDGVPYYEMGGSTLPEVDVEDPDEDVLDGGTVVDPGFTKIVDGGGP